MVAYIFPGQGSQYVGMGKDLYEAFPESRQIFDKADKVLGFSITKMCFEGPQEALTQTVNCQPAILTVSIAALEAFKSFARCPLPVARYLAGLSLGEYSALVASGAFMFEDGLMLVRKRAELMDAQAKKTQGGMVAIIGLGLDKVRQIAQESGVEVANLNCPEQVVISGEKAALSKAMQLAEGQGAKRAIALDVSGAFHSKLMREPALEFGRALDSASVNQPKNKVLSNVTALPHGAAIDIKDNLVKQIYSCVRWEDSVRFMVKEGVSKFIEIGPGKVLKGLMRRIDPNIEVINIEKKEDIISLKV